MVVTTTLTCATEVLACPVDPTLTSHTTITVLTLTTWGTSLAHPLRADPTTGIGCQHTGGLTVAPYPAHPRQGAGRVQDHGADPGHARVLHPVTTAGAPCGNEGGL